jgi:hypothetical protein
MEQGLYLVSCPVACHSKPSFKLPDPTMKQTNLPTQHRGFSLLAIGHVLNDGQVLAYHIMQMKLESRQ